MFILRDIERQNEVAAEFLSKLADAVPSVIASIREGEFSTLGFGGHNATVIVKKYEE